MSKLKFTLSTDGDGDGLPWLPKEAAGCYLFALVTSMEEGSHTFEEGERGFLKLRLKVRWNGAYYRQEHTLWSNSQAHAILQATGLPELTEDTQEIYKKPFAVLFSLNHKGFAEVTGVFKTSAVTEGKRVVQVAPQSPTGHTPSAPAVDDDEEVPF